MVKRILFTFGVYCFMKVVLLFVTVISFLVFDVDTINENTITPFELSNKLLTLNYISMIPYLSLITLLFIKKRIALDNLFLIASVLISVVMYNVLDVRHYLYLILNDKSTVQIVAFGFYILMLLLIVYYYIKDNQVNSNLINKTKFKR